MIRVLAVDDNDDGLFALTSVLTEAGYDVITAQNGSQALSQVEKLSPDIILLDVQMPGPNGYQVTKQLKSHEVFRFIPIILLTGKDSLEDIVYGFDEGADDYIKKPYKPQELLSRIHAALRTKEIYSQLKTALDESAKLRIELSEFHQYENIIGNSEEMRAVFRVLDRIKSSSASVLISGESGTGKELVAQALHYTSPRKTKPFVAQNVSALQDTLLESELFGHVRGAFTGAVKDKLGLFQVADGGTLFLDELGEMSQTMQTKLLRVLQDGTFIPVGDTKAKKVDVRIIGATHRKLEKLIVEGKFREDLFYRLNVIQVDLPPLRARVSDLPLLVQKFLNDFCKKHNTIIKSMSHDAFEALSNYSWPGNVRQLQNEIERVVLLSGDVEIITASHLSPVVLGGNDPVVKNKTYSLGAVTLKQAIEKVERELLEQSLNKHKGNKSEVARELGISRSSVITKVQNYKIKDNL